MIKTPWTSSKPPDSVNRAEGALIVGRDLNSYGGIKAFLLASNQILSRDSFTPAVLTDAIIAQINSFSANSPLLPDSDSDDESDGDASHAIDQTALPLPGVSPTSLPTHSAPLEEPQSFNPAGIPSVSSTDRGDETRYPMRANRTTWKDRVFNLTYKKAKQLYGERASDSVISEVAQMVHFDVWDICKRQHLSLEQVKRIIPCSLFLKEKLFPDGTFDKLKSRLVAGGHKQDVTLYDNVSSPTVSLTTVYVILAIAAFEGHHLVPIDIKGAYLNAKLKSVDVYMRIPPYLAALFVSVYKEVRKRDISEFIESDGSLLVKLKKALYGLVESALLWYEHLRGTLLQIGYCVSQFDRGLFFKITTAGKCYVCVHVDDVLISSTCRSLIDELIQHLEKVYKDLNVQKGNKIFYLGLQIDIDVNNHRIQLSQSGYVADLLREYPPSNAAVSPATDNLFDTSDEGTPVDPTAFASKLMKLAYLAKRTRPDLLLAVSFLATRMKNPNNFDDIKLSRVYEYLLETREYVYTLQPSSLRIIAWIDASYAVHSDARSHTGIIIGFGERQGFVYMRSSVQKIVSDSFTYAELIPYRSVAFISHK